MHKIACYAICVCRQTHQPGCDALVRNNTENDSVQDLLSVTSLPTSKDTVSTSTVYWPDCWTKSQYLYFVSEYSWLSAVNKKLQCKTCATVKSVHCHKTQGVSLAPEWIEGSVSFYGDTRSKQQLSLRKKIFLHKDSEGHKRAAAVLTEAAEGLLSQSVAKQQRAIAATTERVFRTVYKQVKLNRPFVDFESEIAVQVLNGLDMGRILHSNIACGDIARHIGAEMRKAVCAAIVNSRAKFSVLIDESTTISKLSTMIVYIRTSFDNIDPITMFLDLVELNETTASSIVCSLLTCLNTHGLSDQYIRENCVGLATDGASVMLGKKAGVAKLLTDKYPNLIAWHCIAHRLELAVNDTIKEVSGTNNFKSFIDKLYTVYSCSPKNKVELRQCATALEVQLLTIGKVLDTRWVASSLRTVHAVWESFPALYSHFKAASIDALRDDRERRKYYGLAERLTSHQFVQNLGLMYDTLTELSELSLEVQRRSITIPVAHRAICRQVAVFEAMCGKPGLRLQEADDAVKVSLFKGVILHAGSKCDVLINRGQFYRSLSENMKNRLLTIQSTHVSATGNNDAVHYQTLIDQVKVLYAENWPDELSISSSPLYGEEQITALAERFGVDVRQSVRAFREYRDNGGKRTPVDLKPLVLAVDTIPVCTAECERGFSQMNLIISPSRNSLSVSTVSQLLFGKLVGPPLAAFKPTRYVQSWLAKGRHSADDKNSKCTSDSDDYSTSIYKSVWQNL